METKILWITLLAMADKDGIAEASVGGLTDFARLSVEQTKKALIELSSPDEDSRTKEFEGRRIESVEGGWKILNHAKYREKMSADERRHYKASKQREYRQRDRGPGVDNHSTSGRGGHIAEADTEAKAKEANRDSHISTALSTDEQIDDLRKDIETEEKALLRLQRISQLQICDLHAACTQALSGLRRPHGGAKEQDRQMYQMLP